MKSYCFLLALGVCFLTSTQGQAAVLKVNCDKGKQTIQKKLADAVDGDTIEVSGTCFERITINVDNLTLDGGGTAVIDGTGFAQRPLVRVQATNVVIRNFTIQNGPGDGIQVRRSGSAIIKGNTIQNNARNGILVNKTSYALIGPANTHPNPAGTGQGNVIQDNGVHGIVVRDSANAHIYHNKIFSNDFIGINLNTGGSADIDGNEITENVRGINFFTNSSVRLSSNDTHHDANPGLTSLENNLIENNTIGIRCFLGGSADGSPQNFGVGNPGTGGTPHSDDTVISGSCPIATSLGF